MSRKMRRKRKDQKVKDKRRQLPSASLHFFPLVIFDRSLLQSSRRYDFHHELLMPSLSWCCRYDLPRWQNIKIMQRWDFTFDRKLQRGNMGKAQHIVSFVEEEEKVLEQTTALIEPQILPCRHVVPWVSDDQKAEVAFSGLYIFKVSNSSVPSPPCTSISIRRGNVCDKTFSPPLEPTLKL